MATKQRADVLAARTACDTAIKARCRRPNVRGLEKKRPYAYGRRYRPLAVFIMTGGAELRPMTASSGPMPAPTMPWVLT